MTNNEHVRADDDVSARQTHATTRRAAIAGAAAGAAAVVIGMPDTATAETFTDEEVRVVQDDDTDLAFVSQKTGESYEAWRTTINGHIEWIDQSTGDMKIRLEEVDVVVPDIEGTTDLQVRVLRIVGQSGELPALRINDGTLWQGTHDETEILTYSGTSDRSQVVSIGYSQTGGEERRGVLQFLRNNGDPYSTTPEDQWGEPTEGQNLAEIAAGGYNGKDVEVRPRSTNGGHIFAKASSNWSFDPSKNMGVDWAIDAGRPTGGDPLPLIFLYGNSRAQLSASDSPLGDYQLIVANDTGATATSDLGEGLPGDVVIAAKGAPTQTGDLYQALDSDDDIVFRVTPDGKVSIATDTISSGATLDVNGDVHLSGETSRTIKVADSLTANTAGGSLQLKGAAGGSGNSAGGGVIATAGNGSGSGAGGVAFYLGGAGTGTGAGGAAGISGGDGSGGAAGGLGILRGGGGTIGGNTIIDGGNGSSTKGNVLILTSYTGQKLGIGVSSPTAAAHIQAGSSSANTAPLKVNSGTKMSTAEAGALEYDNNWRLTRANDIRFGVGGTLFDFFADAGNTSTTETTLYTCSLPANLFALDGDKVFAEYTGTLVGSGATKALKVKVGGNAIFDSTALTFPSGTWSWNLRVILIRDGSNSLRCSTSATMTGATPSAGTGYFALGSLTLSSALTLAVTGTAGTGGATNDIVAKLGTVRYAPKGES